SGSLSGAVAAASPLTWISLPSLAGSMVAGATSTTTLPPSVSDFSVWMARPSFQNSRKLAPNTKTMPNTTPMSDCAMRDSHDVVVVSTNVSGMAKPPARCRPRPRRSLLRRQRAHPGDHRVEVGIRHVGIVLIAHRSFQLVAVLVDALGDGALDLG